MNRALIGHFCKFIGAVCIFAVLILVGFLLSGSFRSERKAQHINCVSNLKQIGIAFRLWEGDHGDQFPFNVSTNAGGTMELCAVGKDGFDSNAALHLRVMSNELTVPKILVCPQDRSRKPATDFSSLQATNVSYHFYSGTNITEINPQTVLAICPIHGNLLFCDGTVREVKREPELGTLDRLSELFQYDDKFQIGLHLLTYPLFLGLLWWLQDMRPAFTVASGEGLVVLIEGGLIYLICRFAAPAKSELTAPSIAKCWLASFIGNVCSAAAFPILLAIYDRFAPV